MYIINIIDTQPVVHKPFAILMGSMCQLQSPKFHQHWIQPVLLHTEIPNLYVCANPILKKNLLITSLAQMFGYKVF